MWLFVFIQKQHKRNSAIFCLDARIPKASDVEQLDGSGICLLAAPTNQAAELDIAGKGNFGLVDAVCRAVEIGDDQGVRILVDAAVQKGVSLTFGGECRFAEPWNLAPELSAAPIAPIHPRLSGLTFGAEAVDKETLSLFVFIAIASGEAALG